MTNTNSSLHLTILIDNSVYVPCLRAEHGLAVLIETDDVRLLLDTGQTSQVIENARLLGIDLGSLSHVVLSHGHADHTGGLERVLSKAPRAALHAHPAVFDGKYAKRSDGRLEHIGCPLRLEDVESRSREVKLAASAQQLPGGLGLTGEVPRAHEWEAASDRFFTDRDGEPVPDLLVDDQSLYWCGPCGTVVVCGCAHAGVVNTLERVAELTGCDRMHAVLGGFHLGGASQERIDRTIDAFRRFGVERIGLGHCTGLRATHRFLDVFKDKCFVCSVGATTSIGA